MTSVIALRAILGASLALGAIDVLYLDVALAPRVVGDGASARIAAGLPVAVPAAAGVAAPSVATREPAAAPVPAPEPAAEPAPEPAPAPEPPAPAPTPALEPTVAAAPAPAPAAPALDEHVYFATRSADLDRTARATLARLAATDGTFVVEGHADIRGRERFNEKLSRRRALAVESYLTRHGVDGARIEVRYVGEEDAAAAGELWRDRRVDIQITGGPR